MKVDLNFCRVYILDSMAANSHAREVKHLNEFINCVTGCSTVLVPKVLKVSILFNIKLLIPNMQVNKQNNNYDCGLHMLHNITLLYKVSLTKIV